MVNRRAILTSLPAVALAGCAVPTLGAAQSTLQTIANDAAAVSSATTSLASAAASTASAVTFWGIVKGIAQTALLGLDAADPAAGAALSLAVQGVETIVANFPAIEANAEALTTAVASIYSQGQKVLIAAAPHVTVIPNKTA